jgi:putative PIN family toxin of toxin-antitoxin system
MRRPKVVAYVDSEEREANIDWIVLHTDPVEVEENIQMCRDPDDDKFLELAVSGKAGVIISGDKDLKALHQFRETPILGPDEF